IAHGLTIILTYEYTIAPLTDAALKRGRILIKNMTHQACAACQRHKFGLETDQAPRWNTILKTGAAAPIRGHVSEFASASTQFFHYAALVTLFNIDGKQLVRF